MCLRCAFSLLRAWVVHIYEHSDESDHDDVSASVADHFDSADESDNDKGLDLVEKP